MRSTAPRAAAAAAPALIHAAQEAAVHDAYYGATAATGVNYLKSLGNTTSYSANSFSGSSSSPVSISR